MVNSRNEEPDFDTDEDGNSDDESSFGDEGSTEEEGDIGSSEEEGEDMDAGDDSEYESEEESDEDGGDDDEEDPERNMGSEDESEEEEEDDNGEEDDDDSEEDDGSKDMSEDYSDEDGDDMDDDAFKDEENGMNKRGMSSGSLMNEETGQSGAWTKCVPGCIVAMGATFAALFCCCICFIPIVIIGIGLGVGLTVGGDNNKVSPNSTGTVDVDGIDLPSLTIQPSESPTTFAPTEPPLIPITTLTSDADTTIYRDGSFTGTPYGTDTTMLVQNGPPGDLEIVSAYSLIQFDGIRGIDSDTMSIDAYLNSIDGLNIQFCLNRVGAEVDENDENGEDEVVDNTGPVTKYSTCLLPSTDVTETDIETLTGDDAPEYTIPDSCVNGEVTVFEFIAGTTQICIDVTSLFGRTTTTNSGTPDEDVTPALRGRRFLQEDDVTNATTTSGTAGDTTFLFMIDALDPSDKPGDRFYTRADPDGRVPILKFGGENTCRTAGTFKSRVVRENDFT
jgi:hypothetical protein